MKKKIFIIAICAALALAVSGCGGSTAEKAMDIAHAHTGVDASKSEIISNSGNITDAAGNEIIVVDFVNDGTEYICKVDAKNGRLIDVSRSDTDDSEGFENARNAALAHAGLTSGEYVLTKSEKEYDDGVEKYEIEFLSGGREYEYEIDAKTMEVISFDIDDDDDAHRLNSDSITAEDAKNTALAHRGFSTDEVIFTKVKLDEDDGVMVYDIEFVKDGVEYEYEIHAATGAIIEAETDDDEFFMYVNDSASGGKGGSEGADQNLISKDEAVNVALKDAGYTADDVKFTKSELDYDDGIAKYDVEFCVSGYEYDYEINAVTEEIIEKSVEKNDDGGTGTRTQTQTGKEGISLEEAKQVALKNAGLSASEVTFETAKKDRDDGVTYYEIEFYKGGVEYSYEISLSGKILEKDVDRD